MSENGISEEDGRREGLCDVCGKEYPHPWSVANPVWNNAGADGYLCANCFMSLAASKGVASLWMLVAEDWTPNPDCEHLRINIHNDCLDCGAAVRVMKG